MTRDETIEILMVIQAAYPNYKPQDKTVTVNLWYRQLRDYTYQQVEAAVDTYIRTDKSGFAPSIGNVVDKLQMIFEGEGVNELEAWNIVWKAVGSSGNYDRAVRNFEKLPKAIQKAVGVPKQLMEWALTENIKVEVVSSNFMRAYRIEAEREKELHKLSPDVLCLIKRSEEMHCIEGNDYEQLSVAEERNMANKELSPPPDDMWDRVRQAWSRGGKIHNE